jgi:mono/diheme cytochrome c family protein
MNTSIQLHISLSMLLCRVSQIALYLVFAVCTFTLSMQAQDKTAQIAKGEKIYKSYCQTCHQANGQGLSTVYPPVAGSDWIKSKPKAQIVSSVVNGLNGEITVNGKQFNGVMNPLPANYTDDDAAAVLTYVYNSWGNPGTVVSAADVKAARKKTPSKRGK